MSDSETGVVGEWRSFLPVFFLSPLLHVSSHTVTSVNKTLAPSPEQPSLGQPWWARASRPCASCFLPGFYSFSSPLCFVCLVYSSFSCQHHHLLFENLLLCTLAYMVHHNQLPSLSCLGFMVYCSMTFVNIISFLILIILSPRQNRNP